MRVVSFINMKGGVGKTTLAVNVAHCLATRHGKRVLLVDVDPQFNATQCILAPETYVQLMEEGGDTILTVFDRDTRIRASAVATASHDTPKQFADILPVQAHGFDILPGNLELFRVEMAAGQGTELRLRNYVENLKVNDLYDYVIIDTPPTPSVWMTSALIASDFYLIPVKADPISLTGIDLLERIVNERKENFGLSISCAGLVLTIVEQTTNVFKNAKNNLGKDEKWKKRLYKTVLPKRVGIAQNQLEQALILDTGEPDSRTALANITKELLDRVKDNG